MLEIKAMLLTVREFEMQRMQEGSWVFIRVGSLIEVALLTVDLKLFPFGNYVILIVCYIPNVLDFQHVTYSNGKLLFLSDYMHFNDVLVCNFKFNFQLFFIHISFHQDEVLVIWQHQARSECRLATLSE